MAWFSSVQQPSVKEAEMGSVGVVPAGQRLRGPGSDGGQADDAAAADGGRPAVAGAGGESHGNSNSVQWMFFPAQ